MIQSDRSIFFQRGAAQPIGPTVRSFRLVVRKIAIPEAQVKAFETALEAFHFAERVSDLEFAELFEFGRGLCKLRKVGLSCGYIWEITPMTQTAHGYPKATSEASATAQRPWDACQINSPEKSSSPSKASATAFLYGR
jgi:hypothetical protein